MGPSPILIIKALTLGFLTHPNRQSLVGQGKWLLFHLLRASRRIGQLSMPPTNTSGLNPVRVKRCIIGALITRLGFGAQYTINIVRNPPKYYWELFRPLHD